ncbi:MAG: hypothetical protein A2Y14_05550 [Verrucomicrobia bacterium GWF2_51_19]|nr:MAG: hypothetical protein A2Y14_05550 [Verrucomicrobia bacterium GWF2_51_19]HCJ11528.1 DHH family phosphoesterase [Opitutae bacterium]
MELANLFPESILERPMLVVGHIRADGDAIGAQIALCRALNAKGFRAKLLVDKDIPHKFLPFIGDTPNEPATSFSYSGEAICAVDCAGKERLSPFFDQAIDVNIDHHNLNPKFATHNYVQTASSTCELLAELLLDARWPIDAVSANALYLGIVTDSGQFVHTETTAETHRIAATLVDLGAKPEAIHDVLYQHESLPTYKLLQRFLDSLQLFCDGSLCIGMLFLADFAETGTTHAATEDFVNYPRSIDGVAISAFIEETRDGTRVSMRARQPSARLDLIAKNFGGGGHPSAAGFASKFSPNDVVPVLVKALQRPIQNDF